MTSSDTGSARRSPFAVSAWPLRRKVALALAIPLLLALTLGAVRVNTDRERSGNYATSAQQVTVLRPAVAYLTAAEKGMVAAQTDSPRSAADLEAAVEELKASAGRLEEARDSSDLTAEQKYQVDTILDLSRALREDTDSLSPDTWVAQLRQVQSRTTQLINSIINAQLEPEPRLDYLGQALAGRFSLASQQALVATERAGDTGSLELFAELGVEGAAIDGLASAMGTSDPAVAALRTQNAENTRAVRTGKNDLGGREAYEEYDALITSLLDGIDDQLRGAADTARTDALINSALIGTALLLAIIFAFLVAQLLLDPIRRVRGGALTVANEQLPEEVARIRAGEDVGEIEPIDVHTEEEIGQLARAVDDLHRQAVSLAAGEAQLRSQVGDMFVTLSRRNTSLVNQQLSIIDHLEKDERDPERLEHLFRLDHLASRMRRTADSLLLLADSPTRADDLSGLTVTDALQAATAGVSDYRRVHIGAASSHLISDEAAGDVVHLLTELVDNAVTYSPPTSRVDLHSLTVRGGINVEVEDNGLGIPDDELAALNQALSSGGEVTAETARRMGLFVTSRLARRHGITVRLDRNQASGITATVFLPAAILPDLPAPAGPLEPPAPEAEAAAPQAPAPGLAAVAAVDAATDPVAARLDSLMNLPQRRPGTAAPVSAPPPAAPVAPVDEPAPAAYVEPEPPASIPHRVLSVVPDPEPVALPDQEPDEMAAEMTAEMTGEVPAEAPAEVPVEAAAELPVELPVEESQAGDQAFAEGVDAAEAAPVAEVPAEVSAEPEAADEAADEPEQAPEPVLEPVPQPVRLSSYASAAEPWARPVPAAAPTNGVAHAAANGRARVDDDWETPIFRSLRSAWFSKPGESIHWSAREIDEGFERADEVASTHEEHVTASGLPQRSPGSRLVPGGVGEPAAVAALDPEAIRARLAAHAAGVSRGRRTTADNPSEAPHHD